MLYITTVILFITCIGGVILYFKKKISNLKYNFENQRSAIRTDAKKRSGAVQWGKTIEHFVPFMSDFPVPPEDCTFLGMPIDYVAFKDTDNKTKCSVHFVEVKSGSAFLMGKQKNIKKAIEEGRVFWHEIAVDGNSVK
jgi:predicted Holliday junction resolvase-like endonuclease